MHQIHRMAVQVSVPFKAPMSVTIGWQARRSELSVWYRSTDPKDVEYVVVPTGVDIPKAWHLVDTVITDGFYAFHLMRIPS